MRRAAVAAGLCAVALAAGCTTHRPAPITVTTTRTATVTSTRPAPPLHFTPSPPRSVAPLPPGARAPRGERDARCPYLRSGLDQTPNVGVNLAELEGDRVYRTTVITTDHPPGCRFWFYAPPYEAIADIRLQRLASARLAHDAMVLTARRGKALIPVPRFAGGLSGVLYRTRFFGPDGDRDWAFVFAKGRLLVIVHTQRDDTSRNALYIGRAIAAKV